MMHRIGRLGALLLSTLLAGAFVAVPAHAAVPETFLGNAAGRALNLKLLGEELTFGDTIAKATSALTATARGAGQLGVANSEAPSEAKGNGSQQKVGPKCGSLLPNALSFLKAACGSSESKVQSGNPHASSEAEGAVALVSLNSNLLSGTTQSLADLDSIPTLDQPLKEVQSALSPILGSKPEVLQQVVTEQLGLSLDDTLGQFIKTLGVDQTLSIKAGGTTSEVTTVASKVTSTASAEGTQIDLLPLGGEILGGTLKGTELDKPLMSIIVGQAKATSIYDRAAGTSSANFDPALVRVRLLSLTGGEATEIPVKVGQTLTVFNGTPLESTITVANGRTFKNADGTIGAIADGVALHLLKDLSQGLKLDLAHVESTVAGALGKPDIVKPRELPRTGGTPWIPLAGVGLVVAAIVTRRLLATR